MTKINLTSQNSGVPLNLALANVQGESGDSFRQITPIPNFTLIRLGDLTASVSKSINLSTIDYSFCLCGLNVGAFGADSANSIITLSVVMAQGDTFVHNINTLSGNSSSPFPLIVPVNAGLSVVSNYTVTDVSIAISPCIVNVINGA